MTTKWLTATFLTLATMVCGQDAAIELAYAPVEGDVLFQALPHGPLVDAIEGATGSSYSHCGIVVSRAGKWYILEAIGPVKETELRTWISRGRGGVYDAYRLREKYRDRISSFVAEARRFTGRPYDSHYRFDDELIYCSELVYKAFLKATGERMGEVKRLEELNWKPFVAVIQAIEGEVPKQREMITPKDLANANQLERAYEGMKKLQLPVGADPARRGPVLP